MSDNYDELTSIIPSDFFKSTRIEGAYEGTQQVGVVQAETNVCFSEGEQVYTSGLSTGPAGGQETGRQPGGGEWEEPFGEPFREDENIHQELSVTFGPSTVLPFRSSQVISPPPIECFSDSMDATLQARTMARPIDDPLDCNNFKTNIFISGNIPVQESSQDHAQAYMTMTHGDVPRSLSANIIVCDMVDDLPPKRDATLTLPPMNIMVVDSPDTLLPSYVAKKFKRGLLLMVNLLAAGLIYLSSVIAGTAIAINLHVQVGLTIMAFLPPGVFVLFFVWKNKSHVRLLQVAYTCLETLVMMVPILAMRIGLNELYRTAYFLEMEDSISAQLVLVILDSYVFAATTEEILKYLAVRRLIGQKCTPTPQAAIVYGATAAGMFAAVESLQYSLSLMPNRNAGLFGIPTYLLVAIFRTLLSVPGHLTTGVFQAALLSEWRFLQRYGARSSFPSIMILPWAILIHGTINLMLNLGEVLKQELMFLLLAVVALVSALLLTVMIVFRVVHSFEHASAPPRVRTRETSSCCVAVCFSHGLQKWIRDYWGQPKDDGVASRPLSVQQRKVEESDRSLETVELVVRN